MRALKYTEVKLVPLSEEDREQFILDNQWAFKHGALYEFKVTNENELDTLFVLPDVHSNGVGYGAWIAVENMHPKTKIWRTCTPYFDKRNIHFYVNKCGFVIDEFWCEYYEPSEEIFDEGPDEGPDEMFHFIKIMKKRVTEIHMPGGMLV